MNLRLSNQWISVYYQATSEAWENADFRQKLLSDSQSALNELGFTIPENIELAFVEVKDNNFSQLPEFPVSVFDEPHTEKVTLKVPLVPAPDENGSELAHLNSFINHETVLCCCFCA